VRVVFVVVGAACGVVAAGERAAEGLRGLRVETENGEIEVERSEGASAAVEAELRGPDAGRLEAARLIADRSGGVLSVSVAWPGGERRSNESADLSVALPAAGAMAGGFVLASGNGDIAVGEGFAGPLEASSGNGSVRVDGHDGDIDASTGNGAVRLDGVSGSVSVESGNGAVFVRQAEGRAVGRDNGARVVRIDTGNGDIELRLAEAFSGVLELSNGNGGIRMAGESLGEGRASGPQRSVVVVGELDGARSTIRTGNGSIRVRRAGGGG
jgi:DUF4097 and DUF4098 domain-containing protein YvlB